MHHQLHNISVQGTNRPMRFGNETSWEQKVHKPKSPQSLPAGGLCIGRKTFWYLLH